MISKLEEKIQCKENQIVNVRLHLTQLEHKSIPFFEQANQANTSDILCIQKEQYESAIKGKKKVVNDR